MSLYGFEIPHEAVQPCGDKISVKMPFPPKKIGSILTPDVWREFSQHGHQAGLIRNMGPLAFKYKDYDDEKGNTLARAFFKKHGREVQEGDWVLIKWGAGTMFQASKGIVLEGGWRYLSSYNDVVGIIRAEDMPDPSTLCWDESETAMDDGKPSPAPEPVEERKLTDEDIQRRLGALGPNDARADGFGAPSVIRAR